MQTRHSIVVATTPHDRNRLADPTRLLCLPFTQLSSKHTPPKADQIKHLLALGQAYVYQASCPITTALGCMCYM
eukprot:1861231-Ditylum_brightwellii.AAC.1